MAGHVQGGAREPAAPIKLVPGLGKGGTSMLKPTAAAILSLLVFGATAMGQLDGVGTYFDEAATSDCIIGISYTPVTVHVVYSNPSVAEISGYEFGILINQYFSEVPIVLAISGPGADSITDIGQIAVRSAQPIACGAHTTLCSVLLMWRGGVTEFVVAGAAASSLPIDGPFVVLTGGDGLSLNVRPQAGTIDQGYEVCGDLPVESTSWGTIKALYRR